MKKLTALLFSCIVVTGAFAACGKSSSSSGSPGIESVGEESGDALDGSWAMEVSEVDSTMTMTFHNGILGVESDFSSMLCFKGRNIIIAGEDYGSEGTVFEDNKLTVSANGMEVLSMTRTEGEGDSLDGTYTELGGLMLGDLGETSDVEARVKIDGEKLYIIYDNFCDYVIEGEDTVILNYPLEVFSDTAEGSEKVVLTFKVEGDTLSLTDKEGETDTLKRVK